MAWITLVFVNFYIFSEMSDSNSHCLTSRMLRHLAAPCLTLSVPHAIFFKSKKKIDSGLNRLNTIQFMHFGTIMSPVLGVDRFRFGEG